MKKLKLIHKITFGIIILSLAICAVCTGIGYSQYKKYIYNNYNDTAYNVAETVYSMFTEEELFYYIQMAKDYKNEIVGKESLELLAQSPDYLELADYIRLLRENMQLNDIYMAYLDVDELYNYESLQDNWRPMTYIFDSYYVPEYTFLFGDTSGLNPEFLADAIEVAETGERSDNYFISESQYGYNTSAIYPILKDGKTIAVIGVEVPMVTLKEALTAYTTASIISIVIVTTALMILYLRYLYKTLIKPINIISIEAESFVKDENKISKVLEAVHTGDEIETLSKTILQMEIDINEYIDNLTKVTAEKERIGAELNVATQIQADMLPNIFPAFPEYEEFDIFASMTPAKEVGGDFYDFFMVDEKHVAVVMADVSGKGVPAALFMVIAKTLIKNHALNKESLSAVFRNVNNQLCENNEAGMFVTAWMGIMDIYTGEVTFVNAGHNFPLIIRKEGKAEWLKNNPDFILAGMEGMEYEEGSFRLEKGDTLYLYTDGVNEALNPQEELYGDDRLEENLS
ncbi:MAG: serine/threonine-protein phosphatase, partial [Lachnospiraceae bacterium]|nr:serine/threonine-protein phosphatase [Lachnospiraceae bacterium]